MKRALMISLWVLIPSCLYAQAVTEVDGRYQISVDQVFEVAAAGLLKASIQGTMTITSWDQPQVSVRERLLIKASTSEEAREVAAQLRTRYKQRGRTVSIEDRHKGAWHLYQRIWHDYQIERRYEVTLPRAFDLDVESSVQYISIEGLQGNVTLSTIGGRLDLKQVTGRVEIDTQGAEIELLDVAGDIVISTQRSDIHIERTGGSVSIEAGGGTMTLKDMRGAVQIDSGGSDVTGTHFEGTVEVNVQAGDIKLVDVRAAVETGTSAGDVEVSLSGEESHPVRLYTQEGAISLTMPPARPAEITVEIWFVGRDYMGRADLYTDFPLTRSAEVVEYQRRVERGSGRLNGGGQEVFLKTYGGNIHIRKGG